MVAEDAELFGGVTHVTLRAPANPVHSGPDCPIHAPTVPIWVEPPVVQAASVKAELY